MPDNPCSTVAVGFLIINFEFMKSKISFALKYSNLAISLSYLNCYLFASFQIILTTRESEDVWYKSMEGQIASGNQVLFTLMRFLNPTFRRMMTLQKLICMYALWTFIDMNLFRKTHKSRLFQQAISNLTSKIKKHQTLLKILFTCDHRVALCITFSDFG